MRKIILSLVVLCLMSVSVFAVTDTYVYTGADQSFVVPAGVTEIAVKLWGAGGGGANTAGGPSSGQGGAGGYSVGLLAVTPGETLTIKVGGGALSAEIGAGGGGRSAIRRIATELVTAGGGGGAAYGGAGGAGGGTTGQNGIAGNCIGSGGTQVSGGSGNFAGSAFQGGDSNSGTSYGYSDGGWPNGGDGRHQTGVSDGGGGGDGYYGGGGAACASGGGGGGGSGYIGGVTSATTTTGSAQTPPNTGDVDYQAGVGIGGLYGSYDGGNGSIIISYELGQGGDPEVPEFSTVGIVLALIVVGLGTALIIRKKK